MLYINGGESRYRVVASLFGLGSKCKPALAPRFKAASALDASDVKVGPVAL